MSYPAVSTTTILPTTGSLALTTIASLSGIRQTTPSLIIGADTAPFRFSNLRGQDLDIPTGSAPLRFSNFRGAINYNYNYSLYIASGLSTGVQDTDIYYRASNGNYLAPYKAKSLANISKYLTLYTKGASTNSTYIYALRNAVINATWAGVIDDTVTLWMQINNDSIPTISKTITNQTVSITTNTTVPGFISSVLAGLNIQIAPSIITTLDNQIAVNPFTIDTSTTISKSNLLNFSTNVTSILTKLNEYLATIPGAKTYNLSYTSVTKTGVQLTQTASYIAKTTPLCYVLGSASEPSRGQHYVTKSVSVNLALYPITAGSTINFFIGPGPTTPTQGNQWNVTLLLSVINTPGITYT